MKGNKKMKGGNNKTIIIKDEIKKGNKKRK